MHTVQEIAATGVTSFSVELMPRTTRAQSMDALSSMGTICGYKAVLIAADYAAPHLPHADDRGRNHHSRARAGHGSRRRRLAGDRDSTPPGRGRFGLRSAARGEGAGAEPGRTICRVALEVKDAQDAGGYAKAQDESFYQRQRELLGQVVARAAMW